MDRDYVAFISYRHKPLDTEVAEKLHTMLEHYHVPRELRRDGEKTLGLVFRDKEELPLSSDLTESIYEALDHSEFLIVICTPDTPESLWVQKEISYFIEKHGRERVLIVLANGTMEESVPKQLTTIYAQDGHTVLRHVEPLCAYLAESEDKIRALKKEFLRIVAAVLGCPYDSIVQRQKKYLAQRIAVVSGIALIIALVFLIMLIKYNREISLKNEEILQKNQEISEHLLVSQINETKALTLLSNQQRAEGERRKAIENAISALPGEGDSRPYSADAEAALTNALHPYGNGNVDFSMILEQDVDIHSLEVSEDGNYIVTLDTTGNLRCFDANTAQLLWNYQMEDENGYEVSVVDEPVLEFLDDQQRVFFSDLEMSYVFAADTGELVHQIPFPEAGMFNSSNIAAFSPDEQLFIQCTRYYNSEIGGYSDYYEIYDTERFEFIRWLAYDMGGDWYSDVPEFSADNSRLMVPLYEYKQNEILLSIWNTETWEVEREHSVKLDKSEYTFGDRIEVTWLPDNSYILYTMEVQDDFDNYFVNIYKYSAEGEELCHLYEKIPVEGSTSLEIKDGIVTDSHIFYVHEDHVLSVELENCTIVYDYQLELNEIKDYYLRYDDSLILMLQDGSVRNLNKKSDNAYEVYPEYGYRIQAACGKNASEELLCLVPEEKPNSVMLMRSTNNPGITEVSAPAVLEADSSLAGMDIYSFPDQHCFLTAICDLSNEEGNPEYAVTIYDSDTLEETERFTVVTGDEDDVGLLNLIELSADGTRVLLDGYVYDRESKRVSLCENIKEIRGEEGTYTIGFYYPDSVNRKHQEPVLMADVDKIAGCIYWWKDGESQQSLKLPYGDDLEIYNSLDSWDELEVGANGLIVMRVYFENDYLSTEDPNRPAEYFICDTADGSYKRLEKRTMNHGIPAIAVGGTEKWTAFADFDWKLRIYDYKLDTVIKEFELPVSPDTIDDMVFIAEDKYLLIRQDSEKLTVVNTENGLTEAQYDLDFYSELILQTDKEQKYLYICVRNGTAAGLRIDMENWADAVEIPGLFCYLEEQDMILQVDNRNEKITVSPLYSMEELIRQGTTLINGES